MKCNSCRESGSIGIARRADGAREPQFRSVARSWVFAIAAIVLSTAAAGCAAYQPPALPQTHPANPAAAAAPPPASSDAAKASTSPSAAPAASGDTMPSHSGHQMHMHGGH